MIQKTKGSQVWEDVGEENSKLREQLGQRWQVEMTCLRNSKMASMAGERQVRGGVLEVEVREVSQIS